MLQITPNKSRNYYLSWALTGNGIILKVDRIVLPNQRQIPAIELAHRGAHPGQSGLDRRMRYHFYFPKMKEKIARFVATCIDLVS